MRAVYLDTSAALKQVRREEFTDELVSYLVACAGEEIAITSSTLLDVERVAPVLAPVARRQISRRVVKDASQIAIHIRSLDAIHVATAAALGNDLVAVVTYDKQMVRAAEHLGLPVVSPGEPQ